MTCKGNNVWNIMEDEIKWEIRTLQTWRLPVFIIVPICAGIIISLAVYLVYQRIKYYKMLNSTEWEVSAEELSFYTPGGSNKFGSFSVTHGALPMEGSLDNRQDILHIALSRHWPGTWNGHSIGLRALFIRKFPASTRVMNKNLRRTLALCRRSLIHENVLRFYGLTCFNGEHFVITEFCKKGTLYDVLRDEKFNFSLEFKLSLGMDIASGMSFLHSRAIIHANLKSCNCLINERWTVKIADWQQNKLCSVLIDSKVFHRDKFRSPLSLMEPSKEEFNHFAETFSLLWTAPEILNSNHAIVPTTQCDVYSFAIVLHEIFSREDPYNEATLEMGVVDVLKAIRAKGLRPKPHKDTPMRVRQVLQGSWRDDPNSRLTFDQVGDPYDRQIRSAPVSARINC